jgi:c-di-GMP-binding flagellar brake protein YcgR
MERHKGKVQEVTETELKKRLAASDDDRRNAERVPARLQVDVPLANWDQVRSVYTTNISKGGMLFTMAAPSSIPAAVDLTLTLPDGEKVTLQSEVRHVSRKEGSTEFDVGVQFQKLDEATQRAFEDALARLR